MFDSLWPHDLQHPRLPCPSPSQEVCSNSCPLSQWCHPTISPSVAPFSSCPQAFPASGSFPGGQSIEASASAISPSNEYSELVDWFDFLAVQGTLESLLHNSKAQILQRSAFFILDLSQKAEKRFSLLYGPTFISIHDYWKNHSFDYTDLCTSIVTLIVAKIKLGFTGDSDSKESACGVEDPGLIPGSEKSPGVGKGYPLHYSCLENPKDRAAWHTGGLCPWGSQRVRHDWVTNTHTQTK